MAVPAVTSPPAESLLADGTAVGDHFWITAEPLYWWFKNSPQPIPLVTSGSSPPSVLALNVLPGIVGQPGTAVVLGDTSPSLRGRWGGRATAGSWLDEDQGFGVEGGYLYLPNQVRQQVAATSGQPGSLNLAVPYFDATGAALNLHGVPGESVYVLPGPLVNAAGQVFPGFAGTFILTTSSQLQGAEFQGLWKLYQGAGWRLDGLAGGRWLNLREGLLFTAETQGLPGGLPGIAGSYFNTRDQFVTHNDFYGGRAGLRAVGNVGAFFAQATTTLALGSMHEATNVLGLTETNNGNLSYATGGTGGQVLPGGIFAQQSNLGRHATDRFALVPEVTACVGYEFLGVLRVFAGYNLIYASSVVRPGDQMDRVINSTLTGLADAARAAGPAPTATGPAQPGFVSHDSSFWAQGLSVGIELRY